DVVPVRVLAVVLHRLVLSETFADPHGSVGFGRLRVNDERHRRIAVLVDLDRDGTVRCGHGDRRSGGEGRDGPVDGAQLTLGRVVLAVGRVTVLGVGDDLARAGAAVDRIRVVATVDHVAAGSGRDVAGTRTARVDVVARAGHD